VAVEREGLPVASSGPARYSFTHTSIVLNAPVGCLCSALSDVAGLRGRERQYSSAAPAESQRGNACIAVYPNLSLSFEMIPEAVRA
jgi:hypothetical protein